MKPLLALFSILGLIWIVITLPLLDMRRSGAFFSIDPDVMYASNAISYTKLKHIQYIDHPGTPAIRAFSLSFLPLRLISKFIVRENFVSLAVKNLDLTYLYLRTAQSIFLATALLIVGIVMYRWRYRLLDSIAIWISLLTFSALPYFGIVISAEAVNLLVVSLWLSLLLSFVNSPTALRLIPLSLWAGFLIGNRLTNLFLVFSSIFLVFCIKKLTIKQKVAGFLVNSLVTLLGFILATWPIRDRYILLLKWVTALISKTGVHGSGVEGVFDPNIYLSSLTTLIATEKWPALVFLFFLVTLVVKLVTRRIELTDLRVLVMSTIVAGVFIFSKYPLSHYQFPNFLVFVFLGITILDVSIERILLACLTAGLLLLVVPQNITKFHHIISKSIQETTALEDFVAKQQTSDFAVWEWGKSKDFALLWGLDWSGRSYSTELSRIRPNLYQLDNYTQVEDTAGRTNRLLDICWQKLYMQKVSLEGFEKSIKHTFNITPIPNTSMLLLEREGC